MDVAEGFLIGVASSIVATILYVRFSRRIDIDPKEFAAGDESRK